MVKGINVLLARELDGYVFSYRNMLPDTVKAVKKGRIMVGVAVELDNGDRLTSVCTVDSAEDAGIAEGVRVQAAIKAPYVILVAKNNSRSCRRRRSRTVRTAATACVPTGCRENVCSLRGTRRLYFILAEGDATSGKRRCTDRPGICFMNVCRAFGVPPPSQFLGDKNV